MDSTDAFLFSGIAATTAAFALQGGKYDVRVIGAAAATADVQFETLGPDQTTWMLVGLIFTTSSRQVADLASGQYRFALGATAADIFAAVARVPA